MAASLLRFSSMNKASARVGNDGHVWESAAPTRWPMHTPRAGRPETVLMSTQPTSAAASAAHQPHPLSAVHELQSSDLSQDSAGHVETVNEGHEPPLAALMHWLVSGQKPQLGEARQWPQPKREAQESTSDAESSSPDAAVASGARSATVAAVRRKRIREPARSPSRSAEDKGRMTSTAAKSSTHEPAGAAGGLQRGPPIPAGL
jgi:hypothetical protein